MAALIRNLMRDEPSSVPKRPWKDILARRDVDCIRLERFGNTIMNWAATTANPEVMEWGLKRWPQFISARFVQRNGTLLSLAMIVPRGVVGRTDKGVTECVKILLQLKADVNAKVLFCARAVAQCVVACSQDETQDTPAHRAVLAAIVEPMKLLIEAKADLNVKSQPGMSCVRAFFDCSFDR